MNLKEIGSEGADWIYLALFKVQWQAFVNTIMNIRFP